METDRPYFTGEIRAADQSCVPCQYRLVTRMLPDGTTSFADSEVVVAASHHGEMMVWFLKDNLPAFMAFTSAEDGPENWGLPLKLDLVATADTLTITVIGQPQHMPVPYRR